MLDPEIREIKSELSALKTSTAMELGSVKAILSVMDERTRDMQEQMGRISARPPSVPVWVVLTMAAPATITSLALVVLVIWLILGGN